MEWWSKPAERSSSRASSHQEPEAVWWTGAPAAQVLRPRGASTLRRSRAGSGGSSRSSGGGGSRGGGGGRVGGDALAPLTGLRSRSEPAELGLGRAGRRAGRAGRRAASTDFMAKNRQAITAIHGRRAGSVPPLGVATGQQPSAADSIGLSLQEEVRVDTSSTTRVSTGVFAPGLCTQSRMCLPIGDCRELEPAHRRRERPAVVRCELPPARGDEPRRPRRRLAEPVSSDLPYR